jgi:hypothetical protein
MTQVSFPPRDIQKIDEELWEGYEEDDEGLGSEEEEEDIAIFEEEFEEPQRVQEDMVAEELIAPENTKLYFPNVRSWKAWNALHNFYVRHFGPGRINKNGTTYVPDKRVAYVNFFNRHDMQEAIKFKLFKPREAYQIPGTPEPIPSFPAFAVGFENWQISVIEPIAKKLLNAKELTLKEQSDRPGICAGWAVVGFSSREALQQALKKKKFTLKCKNRSTVIAIQPYRRNSSNIPYQEKMNLNRGNLERSRNKKQNPRSLSNVHNYGNSRSSRKQRQSDRNRLYTRSRSRKRNNQRGHLEKATKPITPEEKVKFEKQQIRKWMREGVIPQEKGRQYLRDLSLEISQSDDSEKQTMPSSGSSVASDDNPETQQEANNESEEFDAASHPTGTSSNVGESSITSEAGESNTESSENISQHAHPSSEHEMQCDTTASPGELSESSQQPPDISNQNPSTYTVPQQQTGTIPSSHSMPPPMFSQYMPIPPYYPYPPSAGYWGNYQGFSLPGSITNPNPPFQSTTNKE